MAIITRKMLKWRRKARRGAIMTPATFEKIKRGAEAGGLPVERAEKIAGAAYWATAKAKFRKRRKKKT